MQDYFKRALFFSVLIHAAVFFTVSAPRKPVSSDNKKKIQEIEVLTQEVPVKRESPKLRKSILPPPYEKDFLKRGLVGEKNKSMITKSEVLENDLKQTILADLPKEEELMKIPDYMDYYLSIRNRIKYFVYQNRSGLSLIGDVRFHFIVENSGQVSQVFFDQSLRDNDQIEAVVLKSLKDAAPFSSFPEGLKKHESVPMSMSISFFSR